MISEIQLFLDFYSQLKELTLILDVGWSLYWRKLEEIDPKGLAPFSFRMARLQEHSGAQNLASPGLSIMSVPSSIRHQDYNGKR